MADVIQKAMATIEDADLAEAPHGGFTAVLSTPSLDRDGDELARDEWLEPLPARITIDVDHEMSVRGTVGSARPYFDETGRLMIEAQFASTAQAQETRSLVREGHIGAVSVAFLTDKTKKDGLPRRELLNAGIVAIPSNRDAVILSAKEFAALKDRAERKPTEPVSPAPAVADTKAASTAETNLLQAIHDAAALLGAACAEAEPDADDGSDDGANKSATTVTVTVKPELDMEAFKAQLATLTKTSGLIEAGSPQSPEQAPVDSPADAAPEAAPQGPAEDPAEAADTTAADNSDDVAQQQADAILADLLQARTRVEALDS